MTKGIRKKYMTIILTLAMVVSFMPVMAFPTSAAVENPPVAGFGKALSFNGTDETIGVPGNSAYDFSGGSNFTISMWVYRLNAQSGIIYDQKGLNGQLTFYLWIYDNGQILLSFAKQGASWEQKVGSTTGLSGVPLHQWCQITVTKSGSVVNAYVNGNLYSTLNLTTAASAGATTQNIYIGSAGPASPFSGYLDEVQVFNTALTQDTIRNWMYHGIDATHPNYSNLQLYYKFDDGNGAVAIDYKGTNNGTLTNMDSSNYVDNIQEWITDGNNPLSGYLAGSDAEGAGSLTYEIVDSGSEGSVTISSGNQFTYTPNTDAAGSDTFTYKVRDTDNNESNTQSVNITIPATAPAVTTVSATGVTSTGATLNGTVNANGANTAVSFEYGTTTGYGSTVTAEQSPVTGRSATSASRAITGLALNTTYHYRAVGVNPAGTTYGGDITFTTVAAPVMSSINRTGLPETTNASSVTYRVTFSALVTGVDKDDFSLATTGTADGTIDSVSAASGAIIDVTVGALSGDGTIRLDLNSSGIGIKDVRGTAISGGFTSGQTYTLDTTAPAAPSVPDMTAGTDNGSSNTDNITSVTTPTFTGTAEAGSMVTLYDTDGTTVLGTTTADGSENWSITVSALSAGTHTITAKAMDAAGNVSAASVWLSVTIVDSTLWDGTMPVYNAAYAFSGGSGDTDGDPYLISTAADLAQLSANVNGGMNYSGKHFKMTADLKLNPNTANYANWGIAAPANTWTPIGFSSSYYFAGSFDGDNHSISGIYVNTNSNYQGLFGYVKNGTVKGLGVEDSYIKGHQYVGGVVGYNQGTVSGCYNSGTITGTYNTVGGITGENDASVCSTLLQNCYNTGNINGGPSTGGITGINSVMSGYTALVQYCYNSGSINGSFYTGGVVGFNYAASGSARVERCYNTDSVIAAGAYCCGGVVGWNVTNSGATTCISYCYNTGAISGDDYSGGIVGYNQLYGGTGSIEYCYNAGSITGTVSNVANIVGLNEGSVANCCFDRQISPIVGVGAGSTGTGSAEGLLTTGMTGTNLSGSLGTASNWAFSDGLYPRLADNGGFDMDATDAAYVSAVPVFLSNSETVSAVTGEFTVGTDNGVAWASSDSGVVNIVGGTASVIRQSSNRNITLTADRNSVNRMVKLTVPALTPDTKPLATVDYPNEKLMSLITGADYKINGTRYTADISGKIAIESAWFGTTVSVVKVGNGTTTGDSAAQNLAIPARPAAPSAPALSARTDTSVTIAAIAGAEYSKDGGSTWQAGNEFTGLTPGTDYNFALRYAATAGAFVSAQSPSAIIATDATISTPVKAGPGAGVSNNTVSANVTYQAAGAAVVYTVTFDSGYTPCLVLTGNNNTLGSPAKSGNIWTWTYTVHPDDHAICATVTFEARTISSVETGGNLVLYANDTRNTSAEAIAAWLDSNRPLTVVYDNGTTFDSSASWALTSGSYDLKGGSYTYTATYDAGSTGTILVTVSPVTASITAPAENKLPVKASGYTQSQLGLPEKVSVSFTPAEALASEQDCDVTWSGWTDGDGKSPLSASLTGTVKLPDWATYTSDQTSMSVVLTNKILLQLINLTVEGKTYDKSVSASYMTSGTIDIALKPGETDANSMTGVTLSGTPDITFSDANVGVNKSVHVTGVTLTGARAGLYEIDYGNLSGTISPKPVVLSWTDDSGFVYDNTVKTVTAAVTNGEAGDTVTVNGYTGETSGTDANTYTATASSISDSNYTLLGGTSANYTWAISPAAPHIALSDKTVTETGRAVAIDPAVVTGITGGTVPDGTVAYTYYTDSTCLTPTFAGEANEGSAPADVGTYYVKAIIAASGNYGAGASNAILTIKKEQVYTVSGNVADDGTPASALSGTTIKLMSGNEQVGLTATTAADGSFVIYDVPNGTYNLVTTYGGKTVTKIITVRSSNLILASSIVMPSITRNSILVITGADTPNVVVGGLDTESNNTSAVTSAVITLTVAENESSANAADVTQNAASNGWQVGMILDMDLSKTVDGAVIGGYNETSVLLEIVIPLPAELQGKPNYTIFRYHNGGVDTITAIPNASGEYIEVSADKKQITLYAKKFSTYAIGYANPSSSSGSDLTSYTIAATANEGGSIDPASATVLRGGSKTFTITAKEGYRISDVLVDGASVGATGSYTFNNVSAGHTIKAVFVKDTGNWVNPFDDIKENDWYYNAVKYVSEKGLMNGTQANTFSPDLSTSRAMIVTILWRLEGSPQNAALRGFADVGSGEYYTGAVAWAAANGIVKGYDAGTFGPNDKITREQIAAIFWRYAKYKGYNVSAGEDTNILSYEDALTISEYAIPALQWSCGAGLIKGRTERDLVPRGYATRAETATIITRFMSNIAK